MLACGEEGTHLFRLILNEHILDRGAAVVRSGGQFHGAKPGEC
jgi:hypothetical protein